MKVSITFAALLSTLLPYTVAQDSNVLQALNSLSPCALACITNTPTASNCSLTDTACVCADTSLQSTVEQCLITTCTVKEGLTAKNVTATLCNEPPRDRGGELKIINIATAVMSAFFVLLRLGHKLVGPAKRFGLDDLFIFITLLALQPNAILVDLKLIPNGLGRDIWTLPFDNITEFGKYFYWGETGYFAALALLKLSFLFFYRTIFPARGVQLAINLTIVFNALWGLAFVLAAIFTCWPISYVWTQWDGEHSGYCINVNALIWSNAIISIVVDLWMLAIPLSQLIHIQLSRLKKAGVILMFCLGTLATVVSCVRLRFLINVAHTTNPTWDQSNITKWSNIEIAVGIVCACLPSVRVILVRLMPRIFGTSSERSQRNQPTGTPKTGRSRVLSTMIQGKRIEEDRTINCTTTFTVNQGSKDDDEMELVHISERLKSDTRSESTLDEECSR